MPSPHATPSSPSIASQAGVETRSRTINRRTPLVNLRRTVSRPSSDSVARDAEKRFDQTPPRHRPLRPSHRPVYDRHVHTPEASVALLCSVCGSAWEEVLRPVLCQGCSGALIWRPEDPPDAEPVTLGEGSTADSHPLDVRRLHRELHRRVPGRTANRG
jgi:hypothetical protein